MAQNKKILFSVLLCTTLLIGLYACKKNATPTPPKPVPSNKVGDADGNIYDTIHIGDQVWMGQNLKTTKYANNQPIPLETDATKWENLKTPAYCWYDNNPNNKAVYGALYNWYVVDPENTNKICPNGWHIPSQFEWGDLTSYLGKNAGAQLKEAGTVHWSHSNNSQANNLAKFSAVPSGYREDDGTFKDITRKCHFWMTEVDLAFGTSLYQVLSYDNDSIILNTAIIPESSDPFYDAYNQRKGKSVRCIKDK